MNWFATRSGIRFKRIMGIAELATGDANSLDKFQTQMPKLLQDENPAVRYWAATGAVILGKKAASVKPLLEKRLNDESPDVQVAAAEALWKLGETDKAVKHLAGLLDHDNQWVALRAANVLEVIGEPAKAALPELEKAAKQSKHDYVKRATQHTVEMLQDSSKSKS